MFLEVTLKKKKSISAQLIKVPGYPSFWYLVTGGQVSLYGEKLGEVKGSHQKKKSPKVGTLSQKGGGGSDEMGRMSQPAYLVIFFGGLKLCFREEKT